MDGPFELCKRNSIIYSLILCTFFIVFIFSKSNSEIPRVITALQQQNTAPEVQQYDADPYQTDNDSGGGNGVGGGGSGRGEITIRLIYAFIRFSACLSFQMVLMKRKKFFA